MPGESFFAALLHSKMFFSQHLPSGLYQLHLPGFQISFPINKMNILIFLEDLEGNQMR